MYTSPTAARRRAAGAIAEPTMKQAGISYNILLT